MPMFIINNKSSPKTKVKDIFYEMEYLKQKSSVFWETDVLMWAKMFGNWFMGYRVN